MAAPTLVASQFVEGIEFDETTPFNVTLNGGGSDRLVVIVACARATNAPNLSSLQLDGVAASGLSSRFSIDGGQAVSMYVAHWLSTAEPGAGTVAITPAWDGIAEHFYLVLEYSGAAASSAISTIQSDSDTNVLSTASTTLAATIASESGEAGVYVFAAVSPSALDQPTATDNNSNLGAFTYDGFGPDNMVMGWAPDAEIGSASESFSAAITNNDASAFHSIVAVMFAVRGLVGGGGGISIPVVMRSYRQRRAA